MLLPLCMEARVLAGAVCLCYYVRVFSPGNRSQECKPSPSFEFMSTLHAPSWTLFTAISLPVGKEVLHSWQSMEKMHHKPNSSITRLKSQC